jgi:acyl carrier protein
MVKMQNKVIRLNNLVKYLLIENGILHGSNVDNFSENTLFTDELQMDSLDVSDFQVALEKELDIKLNYNVLSIISNTKELVAYILKLKGHNKKGHPYKR